MEMADVQPLWCSCSSFLVPDCYAMTSHYPGASNLRVSLPSVERVVARNGCLRLECSSVPRGPVRWARVDGQPIHPAAESCSSASPCGEGAGHGEGVLVVEEAREEDGGHYICTASSQNRTAAQVCHVVIGGEWKHTHSPSPTLFKEPEPPTLLCRPPNSSGRT